MDQTVLIPDTSSKPDGVASYYISQKGDTDYQYLASWGKKKKMLNISNYDFLIDSKRDYWIKV